MPDATGAGAGASDDRAAGARLARQAGSCGSAAAASRLTASDLGALLAIDAGVARELMAAGRPAWQVMSGALDGSDVTTHIRCSGDPFGVAYLVASLRV
ncbi:MAG TPA: hypothetical protein VFQ44_12825 [Streptosporangiaceae bacterium]|nr:hypothetical protein [Streptosporangiaceae bacterium]